MFRILEIIKNKKVEYLCNILIVVGVFFVLVSLGVY